MKKIIYSIAATTLFVIVLTAVYYSHISHFRVNVVFYAAIVDGIIATIIGSVFLFTIGYFRVFSNFERVQLLIIWLLVGYGLAISIPTVIDRSLSFYILEKIQQRGGGIKLESFERVFTQEYIKEHRLVDVRLTEQLESGTIRVENGCVKLTPKGERIARFSRYFRQHWLPKKRLLMGEYSDDLTDPFRHSVSSVDYVCR